jgi:hypothetical protein
MAKLEKLFVGQVLHDYHNYQEGNTTRKKEGHWHVKVISIDLEKRKAMCSWNCNPPTLYSEKMLNKLHVNKKK